MLPFRNIRDFSKQEAFTKEVKWAELPLHKHLRIGFFGFCGSIFTPQKSKLLFKVISKIQGYNCSDLGTAFTFPQLTSFNLNITPRNIHWSSIERDNKIISTFNYFSVKNLMITHNFNSIPSRFGDHNPHLDTKYKEQLQFKLFYFFCGRTFAMVKLCIIVARQYHHKGNLKGQFQNWYIQKKMFIIIHKTFKLYRNTASRAKPALWGQSSLSCIIVKEKQCPPSFGIWHFCHTQKFWIKF